VRTLATLAFLAVVSAPAATQDTGCPYNTRMKLETRASPLDSVSFAVGGNVVKICYGRPSLKGRRMIGGEAVPLDTVWRTGANESTKFITAGPVMVGTLEIPAGMYALYTVPGATEWAIIINRSYEQWGRENNYTDEVRAQEIGRTTVRVEQLQDAIETFTIRAEPQSDGTAQLILEWEHTRVRVPVTAK
jgi:hypothetical protein